jgi:hypothetical protein
MFQAVPPPINRSSKLYADHRIFVELFLLLTAIVSDLELVCMCCWNNSTCKPVYTSSGHANQFQLTHDSGKKQEMLDKYLMMRNRLKHVEHL